MNGPRCCGQPMALWQHAPGETWTTRVPRPRSVRRDQDVWRVWLCLECGKERDFYPRPWRWLWVTAAHRDLMDGDYKPVWWLGQVGSLRGFHFDTVTFTVMPFNKLVDLAVRAYNWCRYAGTGDRWTNELEEHYRRGLSDGEARARVRERTRIQEAVAEERRAALDDEKQLRRMLALSILAAGGEVTITPELCNIPLRKLTLESGEHDPETGARKVRAVVA